MKIDGKVAIVTGASGGIGEATARLLAQNGAKVALVARSKGKLEKISAQLSGSKVFVCDMSKFDDIRNMVKKVHKEFGRIDILVNNAGQGYDATIINTDIKKVRDIFELDFISYLVAMQEAVPYMKSGGAIVNISSGTALMALPNMSIYSSIKRAVAGLSLTGAVEFKKYNISVSVVYPYSTDTNFEKNTLKDGDMDWSDFEGGEIAPPDKPELVAEKILEAVKTGELEVYAHSWMKPK